MNATAIRFLQITITTTCTISIYWLVSVAKQAGLSLTRDYINNYMHIFIILASLGSWAGWFENYLVANYEDERFVLLWWQRQNRSSFSVYTSGK